MFIQKLFEHHHDGEHYPENPGVPHPAGYLVEEYDPQDFDFDLYAQETEERNNYSPNDSFEDEFDPKNQEKSKKKPQKVGKNSGFKLTITSP